MADVVGGCAAGAVQVDPSTPMGAAETVRIVTETTTTITVGETDALQQPRQRVPMECCDNDPDYDPNKSDIETLPVLFPDVGSAAATPMEHPRASDEDDKKS